MFNNLQYFFFLNPIKMSASTEVVVIVAQSFKYNSNKKLCQMNNEIMWKVVGTNDEHKNIAGCTKEIYI